jgi:hypothetical protein
VGPRSVRNNSNSFFRTIHGSRSGTAIRSPVCRLWQTKPVTSRPGTRRRLLRWTRLLPAACGWLTGGRQVLLRSNGEVRPTAGRAGAVPVSGPRPRLHRHPVRSRHRAGPPGRSGAGSGHRGPRRVRRELNILAGERVLTTPAIHIGLDKVPVMSRGELPSATGMRGRQTVAALASPRLPGHASHCGRATTLRHKVQRPGT